MGRSLGVVQWDFGYVTPRLKLPNRCIRPSKRLGGFEKLKMFHSAGQLVGSSGAENASRLHKTRPRFRKPPTFAHPVSIFLSLVENRAA